MALPPGFSSFTSSRLGDGIGFTFHADATVGGTGVSHTQSTALSEPGAPVAIVHGMFRVPLNLIESAGLSEVEKVGGTAGDEYLAIDTKSFYAAARPLQDDADFCLYQLIADSEAIGYYVGDDLFEYEGIYLLETWAGKSDQIVPSFFDDFDSITQQADTGGTTTVQVSLDQAREIAKVLKSSRDIADILSLIPPDSDDPAFGVDLGRPAYRGTLTLGLYMDVSPWGSEPRLEVVGATGVGLTTLSEGQFTNTDDIEQIEVIGFDDDYVEDPADWDTPQESYPVSDYEFGLGPLVDPRENGRYCYQFVNWLDTPQKVYKFEVRTRNLVSVVEVNDFLPGHAEWGNLFLVGPSGRYYWRYGSEGWHILEDTGYAVGTIYGENTSPFRNSLAIISIDTGEIIAESIYTFPGGAAGFTDNLSTPKGLTWTKTSSTTYRFMYLAGSDENKIVIADWTVGDDEIDLVRVTAFTAASMSYSAADHEEPGSFWFASGTRDKVQRYDFSDDAVTTVVASATISGLLGNSQISLLQYRKPSGAATGFLIVSSENSGTDNSPVDVLSFKSTDYSLVDQLTHTVPGEINSTGAPFDARHYSEIDNLDKVCIYGYYSSASKVGLITVAAGGTMTIEEEDFPAGWSAGGKSNPWYPFFDHNTNSLYITPLSNEAPWRIVVGESDCLVETEELGNVLSLIAQRHRIPVANIDFSALTMPVWGCQFLQGQLPSLQDLIRRLMVAARFQVKDWDDQIEALALPNSSANYIPDKVLTKSDIVLRDNQPPIKVGIQDWEEVPSGVQIRFLDADLNVTPNMVEYRFPWATRQDAQIFDLTWLTIDKWDARRLCLLLCQDILAARQVYEFTISPSNQLVEAGDLVQFPIDDDITIIALVDRARKTFAGDQRLFCRGVISDESIDLTVDNVTPKTANPFAASLAQYIHLDLPLMSVASDLDGSELLHYGLSTSVNAFTVPLTRLDRSFDDDIYTRIENRYEWPPVATLQNAPTRLDYRGGIDREATLRCQALAGNWATVAQSLSDANTALGTNAVAIGAPGRWEIVYFGTLVGDPDDADVDMVLGNLVSGQVGTSEQTNTQSIGDFAVFVSDITLLGEQNIDTSYLDSVVYYKATTQFTNPIAIDPVERTITGRAEQQPPLYDFTALIDTAGDIFLEAQEQTRYAAAEWLQAATADPLVGDYVLEIYDGATLVRTVDSLANPEYNYTAANQATDFGGALSAGDNIKVAWQRQSLLSGSDVLDGQKRTETIVVE